MIIGLLLIISDDCLPVYSWRQTSSLCSGTHVLDFLLTEASVAGELLVDLLHALYVEAAGLGVVHHGLGVVHADDALGRLLHALRRVPGVVDVLGGEAAQDGQVASGGGERGSGVERAGQSTHAGGVGGCWGEELAYRM